MDEIPKNKLSKRSHILATTFQHYLIYINLKVKLKQTMLF